MLAARVSIFASIGAAAWTNATDGCDQLGQPDDCINTDGCLWLTVEGRCSGFDDPHAQANPACCVGREGSPCQWQSTAEFRDGDCQINLPSNGQVVMPPSVEQMQRFTYLSSAAYCDGDSLEGWNCGKACTQVPGISDVTVIKENFRELQGMVAYSEAENAIVVIFRGTVAWKIENWIQNIDFLKTNPFPQYPDAGVHEGFHGAWKSVSGPVLQAVEQLKQSKGVDTVYCTGHSLGGAIAHHAAFELSVEHGYKTHIFSFGAPRTGDYQFAQAVLERVESVFRITHFNDIVPHVPLQLMGFYHLSSEIYFPHWSGLEHRICDSTGEDKTCSNDCSLGCLSVPDHLKYLDIGLNFQCGGGELEV